MKKSLRIFFTLVIVLGFSYQSTAQFTKEELAEREKWEEFLKTAEIVAQAQPFEKREAVTDPWVLTLEKDGVTNDAIWKDVAGRQKGFFENWRWEIAAYCLDKYLGLNMVPPTVEKRFKGNRGSCQLWVESMMSLKKKFDEKIKTPSYKVFYWNRAFYKQRAFDNLIANEDRHQNQYLITEDWRMILIDHSRSFRTSKKFTKKLIYDEKYKEGPTFIMKELPRALYEKIKSLNAEVIKGVVGEYVTDKEIEAMLVRKDLIVKWVEDRIKKMGEDKVLYD
jgi:outer membrane cobalamin receptor